MSKKIAVFDVCDTLYSVNTTFYFLDNYFQSNNSYTRFRKLTKFFSVKALNHLFYKLFKVDLIRIYATSYLKNESVLHVEEYCYDFVKIKLFEKQNSKIISILHKFRDAGYEIILMSGSYDFIIKEIAKQLEIERYFATTLSHKKGYYTGTIKRDLLQIKHQIISDEIKNINELVVVSDNKSDLNLMKLANEAHAVCNSKSF